MVEAHSERPVMLKPSREFEARYRLSEVVDRPLWLASAFREPDFGAHPWVMWQASDRRRVEGASHPVGWNVVRPE
jgi:lysozyme